MKTKFRMIFTALLILAGAASQAADEEGCALEEVGPETPRSHPICLFFTGTDHYRNDRMADAVQSWKELVGQEAIARELESLQVDAMNNLGYMLFYGVGAEPSQAVAVELWKRAVSLGHDEAEYHLCHAYADPEQVTFDRHRGQRHCLKAEAIYAFIENPSESDVEILSMVRAYQKNVEDPE